ncbi:hypothetical protein FQR65_LT11419 [Abscondita terminalis]|nr:hypothetical protein FQR65_LT11419 [Abscondita terminalis]
MVKLGEPFPNFRANTTEGPIEFYNWLGNSWGILFSHPSDYTPVCTTELARVVQLYDEFQKRSVKMIALSCDTIESHHGWIKDIKAYAKVSPDHPLPYPIIADEKRDLATEFNMIDPDEKGADGMPLTARAVFVIDPNKKMRLSILYPATTGRNFDEILRAIDSLQLTDKHKIATPVDWKVGDDVMVQPTIPEDQMFSIFPHATIVPMPSGKRWCLFISHHLDFNSVCLTELSKLLQMQHEFQRRNVKVITLSCDSIDSHNRWITDIKSYSKFEHIRGLPFPIIADYNRDLSVELNIIETNNKDDFGIPLSSRATFIIDPFKKLRYLSVHAVNIGRNFDEILRLIDALQLTNNHEVATPVNWMSGQPVLLHSKLSEDKLFVRYPNMKIERLPSGKRYMKQIPHPLR